LSPLALVLADTHTSRRTLLLILGDDMLQEDRSTPRNLCIASQVGETGEQVADALVTLVVAGAE